MALVNKMIGSSHSQLRKKNNCSVNFLGGPLGYNPRKMPVEDSQIIILKNNSKFVYFYQTSNECSC